MPSRSQRHLRATRGIDSSGSAGVGAVLNITTTAGAKTNPVSLAASATSGEGASINHLVQWSSDVDGALGVGALSASLSVGAHVITAAVGGLTDTVAVTVS